MNELIELGYVMEETKANGTGGPMDEAFTTTAG